jgi:hypothetical protein
MLGQDCLLAEGDIGAPIYWRTDPPCANSISAPNTFGVPIIDENQFIFKKFIKSGGPNISVRLAYFHDNRLFTGLYKQETEIR